VTRQSGESSKIKEKSCDSCGLSFECNLIKEEKCKEHSSQVSLTCGLSLSPQKSENLKIPDKKVSMCLCIRLQNEII